MAKTLIEIDDEYLAAAQQALGTATKKDTVNAALREVTALAARHRDLLDAPRDARRRRPSRPKRRSGSWAVRRRILLVGGHPAPADPGVECNVRSEAADDA